MSDVKYNEVATIQISDNKNLVISECSTGGYTIAQQMVINDGSRTMKVFLKNAIHIDNLSSLKEIAKKIEEI